VVVQWHLETHAKTFISRLGTASILNLSFSKPSLTYYSVALGDNSVKIIRFDNNKVKVDLQGV
jgi:hypothetical protein